MTDLMTSATSFGPSLGSGFSRCFGFALPYHEQICLAFADPQYQVWTVSLPVTLLNSPNVTRFDQPHFGTGRDIAGVILFAIGFFMETISDIQKYQFRSNPENKGKVCDVGLFVWTVRIFWAPNCYFCVSYVSQVIIRELHAQNHALQLIASESGNTDSDFVNRDILTTLVKSSSNFVGKKASRS